MRLLLILVLFVAWPDKPDRTYDRRYDVASNIWQGTTGNWDTGANWSLGAKPAATDFVVFDGAVSQQSVTTGQDNESAVTIDALWVKENYRGDIGTSALPLQIDLGATFTDYFLMQGQGTLHLNTAAGPALVICDSPNVLDAIALYGAESFIIMKRGRCDVTASHSSTTLILELLGGKIVIAANGAADKVGPIRMVGGECVCSRDWDATVDTAVLAGGVWQQLLNGPDAGLNLVIAGSTVLWDAPAAAGHIPTCILDSGVLDFNNTGDAKTLGFLTVLGGELFRGPHVTLTSFTDFRGTHPE